MHRVPFQVCATDPLQIGADLLFWEKRPTSECFVQICLRHTLRTARTPADTKLSRTPTQLPRRPCRLDAPHVDLINQDYKYTQLVEG